MIRIFLLLRDNFFLVLCELGNTFMFVVLCNLCVRLFVRHIKEVEPSSTVRYSSVLKELTHDGSGNSPWQDALDYNSPPTSGC